MGNSKRDGKQSSNSGSNKPSASADLKIKKMIPPNPEDFMEEADDVNRDTLAENIGSHDGDIPEAASAVSVPRN